jgi:aspartate aminotransferase
MWKQAPWFATLMHNFLQEPTMLLAERTQRITPPSTSKMRELANELRKSGVDVINFAAGELDADASDLIKNAAKMAIDKGCNKYTPTLGMNQLREAIADLVSKRSDCWRKAGTLQRRDGALQPRG